MLMGTAGRKDSLFYIVWILRLFVMMLYFYVVASSPRCVVSVQRTCLPVCWDLGTGSAVSAWPYTHLSLALGVGSVIIHLCAFFFLHVCFTCLLYHRVLQNDEYYADFRTMAVVSSLAKKQSDLPTHVLFLGACC